MNLRNIIAHLIAFICCVIAPAQAADSDSRLEGMVSTTDGQPITNALVIVYSAAPREGLSVVCPTCYPDCGRRTFTDAEGRFSIEKVNPDLMFRLLVAAMGYRPDYIRDADPLFGGAQLRLKPLRFKDGPVENRVVGKLIDPAGRAVPGARITADGTRYGPYSYSSSTSGKVDPMAVSDENGEFFLVCTNGINAITVTIDVRGLAKRKMWLDTGKAHLIRLKEGVAVTGRLMHAGKPIPGATVSMNTQERSSEVFLRGFDIATDSEGRFRMPNIPAETKFFLYTKMKEMQELGVALGPQPVDTGANGTTTDLGELELRPSYFLRGRVVAADGKPLPARTSINLGLEDAWDNQSARLDDEGWFEFLGVPADSLSLSIRVPGYRISAKNPSKDWLNEGLIVGRLTGNQEEFIIHLERGDRFQREDGPPNNDRQPRDKPLRGAKL